MLYKNVVSEEERVPSTSSSSRLAAAVATARRRRGWSREQLAHEAGLSFAAITQIETGRRTEVRVSSLVALADALGVSVDYLVRGEVAQTLLDHRAYVYDSAEHLADIGTAGVLAGLEAGHKVLLVTSKSGVAAVRRAVGSDGEDVTYAESSQWYTTPADTTARYAAFARDARNAGAHWIDIFGEPIWTGRTRAERLAWTRYESLINLVFAPWPVSVGCLYSRRDVPKQVQADLERTHPGVVTAAGAATSASFEPPESFMTR